MGHLLEELSPDLASRPLHFEAPPLDEELLGAIRRISPQFHLKGDERSRLFWQHNQNGLCWGEYDVLAPYLRGLEPEKVLDIGPGLGRSVVFFKNALGWEDVPFHLFESTGDTVSYDRDGPRSAESFCGDFNVLEKVLAFNQIHDYEIFDARALDNRLVELPGPYDFVYSFFAVGWHWSILHFLDEILEQLTDRGIGAFTLHPAFESYSALERVPHRLLEFQRSWPRNRRSELVVLSKSEAALAAV
jgi:hypothetical protein